ncbi:hypothetical protein B0G80_7340 [Paraburkholderia sp. BL6669N2]|uniref:hypothetical protein n=1 Tax=Paraburkholderia sp. BL6669N2 TaxID=1938807 RepID=UPI000E21D4CD|nr:hypothetical protein [Paraburkholderia sp. BL6669N2]REG50876.1 hypothetical protein B0G80_7340 [Paraburkholderia sp. BL6669N2]
MSNDTSKGTANILHQFSEYIILQQEYSTQTANELAARSLAKHGVEATPAEVGTWHKLNMAATQGKMDIYAERMEAESSARVVATAMIALAQNASESQFTFEEDVEQDDESDSCHDVDDDRLTIDEIYGYDDPEDNAEAALDDVLKIQERGE